MKKFAAVSLMMFLFLSLSSTAHADTAFRKFSRGVVNIATSPLEYAVQFQESAAHMNMPMAFINTLFVGTGVMATRIVAGAYDLVTFPFPLPSGYKPVIYPETALEALQDVHGTRSRAGVFVEQN